MAIDFIPIVQNIKKKNKMNNDEKIKKNIINPKRSELY
jgi:hypothetical protein